MFEVCSNFDAKTNNTFIVCNFYIELKNFIYLFYCLVNNLNVAYLGNFIKN